MCCLQHVSAPLVSFPGEKANAAELDRWGCVAQPPSCHEEPGSQKKKKGRRIPPRLRYASPPPVGGKTVSEPRDFSGGAGGSAPSHGAGDAVASPRRNSPLREKAPQGHFSVLTARISGFLRPDGQDRGPEYSGPLGTFYAPELIASNGITFALCCLMASFRALMPFPMPPAKQKAGLTMYVLDRPDFGP